MRPRRAILSLRQRNVYEFTSLRVDPARIGKRLEIPLVRPPRLEHPTYYTARRHAALLTKTVHSDVYLAAIVRVATLLVKRDQRQVVTLA